MRRGSRLIAALLLVLLAAWPASASASGAAIRPDPLAAAGRPALQAEAGGKVEILDEGANRTLAFETAAAAFAFPLTLHETTGEAGIDDLAVEVGRLLRKDGAPGEAVELTLSPAGPFGLPAGGYQTVMLAGSLPDAAEYRGWLALKVDGQVQSYTLAVTRPAAARLAVLEASQAGDVALSVRGPAFEPALTLRVPAGKPAIADLAVEVTGLSRQDGEVLQGETLGCSPCTPDRLALAPGVAQAITLKGRDFRPGSYKAFLRLGYEGVSQDVPLIITRAALAANLQVDKPATVAVVNWLLAPTTADVPIDIREAQGQGAQIYYPDHGSLVLTTPGKEKLSAVADRVEILRRNDAGSLETLPPPSSEPGALPVLGVDGGLELVYRLTGVGQAGTYTGKVTVAGPDSQAVTQDIEIQVKHGFVFPLLAILAGVYASYRWHFWTREGRTRALLGRDIARTRESVEAAARDGDATWGVFVASLNALDEENRDGSVTLAIGQARLGEIQVRRGHWGKGRAAHDQAQAVLREYLAAAGDPPTWADNRKVEAGDKLRGLRSLLENASPLAEIAAAVADLEALLKTVREEAVRLPARNLVEALALLIKQSADRPKVRDAAETLKEKASAIEAAAADPAEQAASMDRLRDVKQAYAVLRIDLTSQSAAQLQASQAAAPEGEWTEVNDLLARVGRGLSDATGHLRRGAVDASLAAWSDANEAYLGASILHLEVLASPQGHPEGMAPEKWNDVVARTPALRDSIKAAKQAWEGGDPAGALTSYEAAQDAFLQVQVAVLREQMAAFAGQVGRPAFLAAADLDQLWREGPGKVDVAAAVAGIEAGLAAAAGSAGDQRLAYRLARVKFAALQREWLAAGQGVLAALRAQAAPAGFDTASEVWQTGIPGQLQRLDADLAAGRDLLAGRGAAGEVDEARLLQAEQRIYAARRGYVGLVESFGGIYTRPAGVAPAPGYELYAPGTPGAALAAPVVQPEAGSGPTATAPAAGAGVAAGGLAVAGAGAIVAAPPWSAVEPRSSAEWGALIRRQDCLVFWISLFIASISGLAALYLTDPTFGSLANYIAAILWGFGIQAGTQLAAGGAGSVPDVGAALGID